MKRRCPWSTAGNNGQGVAMQRANVCWKGIVSMSEYVVDAGEGGC